jgi:predicted nucleotidyltransferase
VPDDLTEYEDVSPYLLGRDVGEVVDPEARRRVVDFVTMINDEGRGLRTLLRMTTQGPPAWRDPDVVLARIRAFGRGLDER